MISGNPVKKEKGKSIKWPNCPLKVYSDVSINAKLCPVHSEEEF